MTNEPAAPGPQGVTVPDGSSIDGPTTPSSEEHALTKSEYNRRRLDELFENLNEAGPPSESWVGIDAEGNAVGSSPPPEGTDGLRYSLDQILLVKREGALAAVEAVADELQQRATGIVAGESNLDPETAAATMQQLQATEAALGQLVALLDLHADGLKAHHSNLTRAGFISTDHLSRAQFAQGVQDFLLDFGSLMADLASVADFAGSLKKSGTDWAEGRTDADDASALKNFLSADGVYEGLKDIESGLNTVLSNVDPGADEIPIFNDLFGAAPFLDEKFADNPIVAVQTIKSHVSDVANLCVDFKKDGKLNVRSAGQLVARLLKSVAEWDQALRAQQIKELVDSIAAVDSVLATPFVQFVAVNEQKHVALEGLHAVREARLALHASLGLVRPGVAAADWPVPPHGLTVEQLLALISTLADETNPVIDGGMRSAATPTTVAELDAAIADAEGRRAAVIRRDQQLTSRSAGLDYLNGREQELLGNEATIRAALREARGTVEDIEYQPFARTPRLPRSPGGRPSYPGGTPEWIRPAQADAEIRDLEAEFRSNTEQLDDVRRDQAILREELDELPILQAERAALEAELEHLRRERDAQTITDAITDAIAEDEARNDLLERMREAAASFFSGRWLIAMAIGVIVFGVVLGFTVLRGDGPPSPVLPADEVSAATAPVGQGTESPGAAAGTVATSQSGASPPADPESSPQPGDSGINGGVIGCGPVGVEEYFPLPASDPAFPGFDFIPDSLSYARVEGGLSICLEIPAAAAHQAAIASGGQFLVQLSLAANNQVIELTVSSEDGVEPSGRLVQRAGGFELQQFPLDGSMITEDVAIILIPATFQGDQVFTQFDSVEPGLLEFIGIGASTYSAGGGFDSTWSGGGSVDLSNGLR